MLATILLPAACLGGLGLLAEVGLVLANRFFAVQIDPREEAVNELLPGANCGGCGHPGCAQLAASIASGKAPPTDCPVLTGEALQAIGSILGIEVEAAQPRVARVLCKGTEEVTALTATYDGLDSCRAGVLIVDSTKSCVYACMGLGDCVAACPFDAMTMGPAGLPVVDEEACNGCNNCVVACPKQVLALMPRRQPVYAACHNPEKGKLVSKLCAVGCIDCELCAKRCPHQAIAMEGGLPQIDAESCENCGVCAAVCRPGSFVELDPHPGLAVIDADQCSGCNECVKPCPVKALKKAKEAGAAPLVAAEKCVGCQVCAGVCPEHCIRIVVPGSAPASLTQAA